jgi:hypothetical protein
MIAVCARHIGTGRTAEAHDVKEHAGAVVARVIQQFLHKQRADLAEQPRHRERQYLRGHPGSMPVAWNEARPCTHAFSKRSTTCGPALAG